MKLKQLRKVGICLLLTGVMASGSLVYAESATGQGAQSSEAVSTETAAQSAGQESSEAKAFAEPQLQKDSTIIENEAEPQPTKGVLEIYIDQLYSDFLGRPCSTGENDAWEKAINDKKITIATVITCFFDSEEYHARNLGDEHLINAIYRSILYRDADPTGLNNWSYCLKNGCSRYAVLEGILGSQERRSLIKAGHLSLATAGYEADEYWTYSSPYYTDHYPAQTALAYQFYQQVLGRTPGQSELEGWCRAMAEQGVSGVTVAEGFLFSNEFTAKNLSDKEYVNVLYRTLLGRSVDPTGEASWTGSLADGSSRYEVFNGVAQSPECQNVFAAGGPRNQ